MNSTSWRSIKMDDNNRAFTFKKGWSFMLILYVFLYTMNTSPSYPTAYYILSTKNHMIEKLFHRYIMMAYTNCSLFNLIHDHRLQESHLPNKWALLKLSYPKLEKEHNIWGFRWPNTLREITYKPLIVKIWNLIFESFTSQSLLL